MSTTTIQPKSPPIADDLTAVPRGYKRTEVGVIPEDWEVNKLDNLCFSIVDGTHYTPKYINEGIPFFSVENVTSDNFSNTKFISQEDHDELTKRCKLEKGDILLTRIGSLGKTKLINWDVNASIYVSLALIKPNNRVLTDFLYRYSESSKFIANVEKRSLLNAIPMKINMGDIGDIPIPVPSFPEQLAIAAVLNDMGALITSLDNLIAKKRLIKLGAMHQLLTGKTRLPGFSGKWKVKKLGEIGTTYSGLSGKSKVDFLDGEFPYIPFMNIMNNPIIKTDYFDYVNVTVGENQNKAQKGDLFFNGSSETPEEVGMCSVLLRDNPNLFLNSFCFGFRLNNKLKTNGLFLVYFFRSVYGRKLIYSLAQGATRYNLSKSYFLQLEISFPSSEEQTSISTILSDMDAEITALEHRRDKIHLLKQGMMQELLTGKTRLI